MMPSSSHSAARTFSAWWFLLLGPILIFAGCSQSDTASLEQPPVEASWERQLDAVQGGVTTRIEITESTITEDQLRQLLTDCSELEILLLDQFNVVPATLSEVLLRLPALRQLKLGSEVPATVFPQLAQLLRLEVLNLPNAQCGDDQLALLVALPRLKLLRLHSPVLTDAGLKSLPQFPALRYLHLINTPITDIGLSSIAQCEQLESFYLDGGHCTDEGLSALIKQRPKLHFHWNDLHLADDPNKHPHD